MNVLELGGIVLALVSVACTVVCVACARVAAEADRRLTKLGPASLPDSARRKSDAGPGS